MKNSPKRDSGNRSSGGRVGQTIVFCRLSTPGRFAGAACQPKHFRVRTFSQEDHIFAKAL
jgi:hypothetical protein